MTKRELRATIELLAARVDELERHMHSMRRDHGRAQDRPGVQPLPVVDALRAENDTLKAELSAATSARAAVVIKPLDHGCWRAEFDHGGAINGSVEALLQLVESHLMSRTPA